MKHFYCASNESNVLYPFYLTFTTGSLSVNEPKFLNNKDADDEDLMRLKKLLKMISVSKSQWLKAEERKSLSQSTVTENPWASMAWYNETPVQSTPGKDLINLSPSVVHKKGSVGKNREKDSFLTFLAGSALWGWVWRLWSSQCEVSLRKFGWNCLRRLLLSLLPELSSLHAWPLRFTQRTKNK